MEKYVVAGYVIMTSSRKRIGRYLFKKFNDYEPVFEPECCLCGYKTYVRKNAAQKTADRINAYFKRKCICIEAYVEPINNQ